METIIGEVNPSLIAQELTAERFLRNTNKAGNEIYVVDAHCAPHTMREIGRLREITFRVAGGGTGKSCDIDEFDLMPQPCQQLIVWNPAKQEIVGAYRFIFGENVTFNADGSPHIATSHMFHFSQKFINEYLPHTIELGRSFVRLEYQSTQAGAKAIYALDNLWDGIWAISTASPQVKYFFGKFTMYPNYPHECRDLILHFLRHYFPDADCLVTPHNALKFGPLSPQLQSQFVGNDFKTDYRTLNVLIRARGFNIPPLVNAYMRLSPTMRMFGTAINDEFGNVEESGILINIDDIAPAKKERHNSTSRLHTSV